jgi:hypothetical protein
MTSTIFWGQIMNRLNVIIITTIVLAASISACADLPQVESNSVIGKVDGVFIREHRGLYVETSLIPRDQRGKELWALVRFAAPVEGGRTSELTMIPPGVALRTGDAVEISLGDNGGITSGPLPTVSRVVRRVDGVQTLAAEPSSLVISDTTARDARARKN